MEKGAKLTKGVVNAAEPTDKRYEIWDSELAGFGLRLDLIVDYVAQIDHEPENEVRTN